MEVVLLNLLGKALSAKEYEFNCSVSVLSSQFQRKSWFVLVYIDLQHWEILKTFFEEINKVISEALC